MHTAATSTARFAMTIGRPLSCAVLAIVTAVGSAVPGVAAEPGLPALKIIPAGTTVEEPDRDRWNRVVLLATPQFVSGDTDAVSADIRDHVASFTFTVLATVRPTEEDASRHELVEVGIGYATAIDGRLTVVAPDAKLPGFAPDFLGRQILGAKQKSLVEIECVGAHGTALAFDAATLMLRDDEHREMTVRHVVRIDPRSGDCSTCVWLAESSDDGTLAPADDPMRIVTGGTRESRPIHVDGSRFVFGYPTKQAFALKELPPGGSIPWTPSLLALADAETFDGTGFRALTVAIDEAADGAATLRSARNADTGRAE